MAGLWQPSSTTSQLNNAASAGQNIKAGTKLPLPTLQAYPIPPEQCLLGRRVGHKFSVQSKQRARLRQLRRQQRRKGGLVQPHLWALVERGAGRGKSIQEWQTGVVGKVGRGRSTNRLLARAQLVTPACTVPGHAAGSEASRTCSGGMRQSARKPSGVSTGRGGSGGSSAARRTASTCGEGMGHTSEV